MSNTGPNTIPHVADTGPADLDDISGLRKTLRCPPCNGACNQGRKCSVFSPVLSRQEREDLEGTWTWVDIGIAVALVLIIAGSFVSPWF